MDIQEQRDRLMVLQGQVKESARMLELMQKEYDEANNKDESKIKLLGGGDGDKRG